MYLVKEIIPGSGKNWTIPPVLERTEWLASNTSAPFKAWWGGLWSDEHCISFEDEQDATAYVLRWSQPWK